MNHTSDCATVMYSHLDPQNLKKPLICDCGASDPAPDDSPDPTEEQWDEAEVSSTARAARAARVVRHSRGKVMLEGGAADAVTRLRAAKAEYDAALKAVVEELTK